MLQVRQGTELSWDPCQLVVLFMCVKRSMKKEKRNKINETSRRTGDPFALREPLPRRNVVRFFKSPSSLGKTPDKRLFATCFEKEKRRDQIVFHKTYKAGTSTKVMHTQIESLQIRKKVNLPRNTPHKIIVFFEITNGERKSRVRERCIMFVSFKNPYIITYPRLAQ
jgi:hypothetical protein